MFFSTYVNTYFCCIRTTVSDDYISDPVYYRSNSSLEKNRFATDCNIVINEFELELCNFVHFRTNTFGDDGECIAPQFCGG